MEIRPYQASDAAGLTDIWLAASLQAHAFIPAAYWQEETQRMRDEYLPQSENLVLVDDDGSAQGFISLIGRHIAALFVHPSAQGKGYGSALLRRAQQLHDKLTLNVYEKNNDSIHFYQYHGFSISTRGIDPATGESELRMRWQQEDRERSPRRLTSPVRS